MPLHDSRTEQGRLSGQVKDQKDEEVEPLQATRDAGANGNGQSQPAEEIETLIDSIHGLLWHGKAQGPIWRFTRVTKQAERFLGFPPERWWSDPDFWKHQLHPADRRRVVDARSQMLARGKDHVLEYRLIHADGHAVWVRDSVTIQQGVRDLKLQGVLINITELKEIEDLLRRSHRELEMRVQERTAELVRICDELQREISERKRLEKELLELTERGRRQQGLDSHGNIGQSLAGIALMVKSLGTKLEKTSPQEAGQAERIQSLVDQTMSSASHDPAQDLVAEGMQEPTLPMALKGLATRTEELLDVSCRFRTDEVIPSIDPDVASQLYNIALDAVVNAVKYAEAKRITIILRSRKKALTLTIEEDGHPFPTPLHNSLELALKVMRYRAKLINAHLQIREKGTRGPVVTCIYPAPAGVMD